MVIKGVAGFCLVMVFWRPKEPNTPNLILANVLRAREESLSHNQPLPLTRFGS